MKNTLVPIAIKGGASPGAIMQDEHNNTYIVKLGIPASNGPYQIVNETDVEHLTQNMSKKSCEEKMFFRLAQEIGGGYYQLPETNVTILKPSDYESVPSSTAGSMASEYQEEPETINNTKNVLTALRHKIKIPSYVDNINTEQALNAINNTDIVHFSSQYIDNYQDLAEYYNYSESIGMISNHKKDPLDSIPDEPQGMGAFFALSCCAGNNDSIGSKGRNAGFNPVTNQIIVIDGGNANYNPHMISKFIPTSDNNSSWLSYDYDLSASSQKEACETFIKFASLNEEQLYNIITNGGKTASILGEDYIQKQIVKLLNQQDKIIEVFYDEMIKHKCVISENLTHKRLLIDSHVSQINSTSENRSPNLDSKKRYSPRNAYKSKAKRLDFNFNFDSNTELEISNVLNTTAKLRPSKTSNTQKAVKPNLIIQSLSR